MKQDAGEWQHFGAPPKGSTLVELVSELGVTPIQLAGTTDPPTVLMNGERRSGLNRSAQRSPKKCRPYSLQASSGP